LAAPLARQLAAHQVDVSFLAGLEDAELDVDGGEFGDDPVRDGFRAVRRTVIAGIGRKIDVVVLSHGGSPRRTRVAPPEKAGQRGKWTEAEGTARTVMVTGHLLQLAYLTRVSLPVESE